MSDPKPGEKVDVVWLAEHMRQAWRFASDGLTWTIAAREAIRILGDVRAPQPESLIVGELYLDAAGGLLRRFDPDVSDFVWGTYDGSEPIWCDEYAARPLVHLVPATAATS